MFNTKRTWKRCDDKRIVNLFNEVATTAKTLYPNCFNGCTPELFIDSSTKYLGKCVTSYRKKYNTNSEISRDIMRGTIQYDRGVILLSKYILDMPDKEILDTLSHEFGHFVTPGGHHSYLWRVRANHIGSTYGVTCDRLADTATTKKFKQIIHESGIIDREYKYTIECPKCHATWKRKKMSRFVEQCELWKCGKCGVSLHRIK